MASTYPGTLDALATTRTDATASPTTHAADHNNANDAINKIEAELGVNPRGSAADLATRLGLDLSVRKTADQTNSTVTLANVTDLVFPVAIGGDYTFDFYVPYTSATATVGVGFAVTCPALTGYIAYEVDIGGFGTDGTAANFRGQGSASGDLVLSTATSAINTVFIARIYGVVSNPSAAGSIQLQHRSETATLTTVKKGASGWMRIN